MNRKLLFILIMILIISSGVGCISNLKFQNLIEEQAKPATDLNEVVYEPEIEKPKIDEISILAVGDIMFHSPQIRSAYLGDNQYDFSSTFKYVKKYIEESDIALANFETVTVEDRKYSGFPRFNSPKATLKALGEVGFDILSTANNHSLDQGKKGILSTLDTIEEYGLKNIGTNRSPDESILIEEIKGIKIGFLSYTYGLNGLDSLLTGEELSYMVNLIDEKRIEEDIKRTKELGVDLTVVYIHWGHEYHREPSPYQIELGEKMVDWGANIILGSHPHVIQRGEIIEKDSQDNFIIYSMGNFLSNQRLETMGDPYTEDGVMVKIKIEKDFSKDETRISELEFIPTWVYKYTEDNKYKYEILPIEEILLGNLEMSLNQIILSRIDKSIKDTKSTLSGN